MNESHRDHPWLRSYRAGRSMSAAQRERVRARLAASIAAQRASTPRAGVRPIVVALALAAAAAAVMLLLRGGGHEQRLAQQRPRDAAAFHEGAPLPARAQPAVPPAELPRMPATATPPATPVAAPIRREPPRAAAPPEPSALQAELASLQSIRDALDRGDVDGALASLRSHAQRFARPQLDAEHEALRIEARCRAGDVEVARAAARQFVERWPSSGALAAVPQRCR